MTEFGKRMIRWSEKVCENIALVAMDTLFEQAPLILTSDYYEQYPPEQYDRTFNFLNNSYAPFFEKRGTSFSGGIYLSPDEMDDYEDTELSKDKIYDFDMAGYHGAIKYMSPFYSIVKFSVSQKFVRDVAERAVAMTGKPF